MIADRFQGGVGQSAPLGPILRDGLHEYRVARWHERLPENTQLVQMDDFGSAVRLIFGLAQDQHNLAILYRLASDDLDATAGRSLDPRALSELIGHRFATGDLRLLRVYRRPVFTLLKKEEKEKASEVQKMKATFSLKVVDDATDDPIADLKLIVKIPGGSDEQRVTDSTGRIDVSATPAGPVTVASSLRGATIHDTLVLAGTGAISRQSSSSGATGKRSGAKQFLAQIVQHRVRTGDTLESVAKQYGVSVEEITQFNWSTTDRGEVDKHLWIEVGCSKRGADKHYVFDDSDLPGILSVPKPLDLKGLSWDELHILRVKGRPGFRFSM